MKKTKTEKGFEKIKNLFKILFNKVFKTKTKRRFLRTAQTPEEFLTEYQIERKRFWEDKFNSCRNPELKRCKTEFINKNWVNKFDNGEINVSE